MVWDARVHALADSLVQVVHVSATERRFQGEHLVNDAAKTPNVRFETIGLVLPYLRRGVIGRARLSVIKSIRLCYLADIHITQFGLVQIPSLGLF